MNYPIIIGKYYRLLGWLSLSSAIYGLISLFWTNTFHFDLTFIIWFWLGSALIKGSNTARKWAIGISVIYTIPTVLFLATGTGQANLALNTYKAPRFEFYAIALGLFILIGVPGLLLLLPKAKRQFIKKSNQSVERDG